MSDRVRVLIVEGRFYSDISDELLAGAKAALDAFGAEYEVVSVPGALEIPPAISIASKWGAFDGYVALGCVIRGETYHFDIVSNETSRGLMDLAVRERLPIGNGVLTVESESQAIVRSDPAQMNKGGGAARAAVALYDLRARYAP